MKKLNGEASVKKAVEDLLKWEHIPYWRLNSGDRYGIYKGKTWRIRGCEAGTADILAAPNLPMGITGIPEPVFLWIEAKRPDGGTWSKEQQEFADTVRNRGHYYLLVKDVSELQTWLKDSRAR